MAQAKFCPHTTSFSFFIKSIMRAMADSNASFIPKNTQRIQKKVRTTYRIYLLSYLSYVFFFGTLIAVIGTYFYAIQVKSALDKVKVDLEQARQAFSETDIEGVRELEKRLLTANQLLGRLASPTKVFSEVEKLVADNIRFTRFSYEALPGQKAVISLTGKADDFNQIIYQRDLMNGSILFESAPKLTFDYAGTILGEETGGEVAATENTDDATLTFTVDTEFSTTLIPYQGESAVDTNVVTDVRGSDIETAADSISSEINTDNINESDTAAVGVNEANN